MAVSAHHGERPLSASGEDLEQGAVCPVVELTVLGSWEGGARRLPGTAWGSQDIPNVAYLWVWLQGHLFQEGPGNMSYLPQVWEGSE